MNAYDAPETKIILKNSQKQTTSILDQYQNAYKILHKLKKCLLRVFHQLCMYTENMADNVVTRDMYLSQDILL